VVSRVSRVSVSVRVRVRVRFGLGEMSGRRNV